MLISTFWCFFQVWKTTWNRDLFFSNNVQTLQVLAIVFWKTAGEDSPIKVVYKQIRIAKEGGWVTPSYSLVSFLFDTWYVQFTFGFAQPLSRRPTRSKEWWSARKQSCIGLMERLYRVLFSMKWKRINNILMKYIFANIYICVYISSAIAA